MADIIDRAGMPKSGDDGLDQKSNAAIADRALDGDRIIQLFVEQPVVMPGRRNFHPVILSMALFRGADIAVPP